MTTAHDTPSRDARLLADAEQCWWFRDGDLCEPLSILGRGIDHVSREAQRVGYEGHEAREVEQVMDRWFGGKE